MLESIYPRQFVTWKQWQLLEHFIQASGKLNLLAREKLPSPVTTACRLVSNRVNGEWHLHSYPIRLRQAIHTFQ
uniref:Uncharacterized protein n=1 Tax=Arundo donax TaxID=35708 RepID=A0A0A8Z2Z4_ARUDO